MKIENPIFQIPDTNNRKEQKSGGGNPPVFRGNKSKFEKHKRERVREADSIIDFAQRNKISISAPGDKLFYEIEFHEDALSKSAQPRRLLEQNHIDIYAQVSERSFLASSTTQNLKSFRDSISKLDLVDNKNESAYLSAITKIDLINKDEKLTFPIDKENNFRTYLFLADVLSEEDGKTIAKGITEKTTVGAEYFTSQAGSKVIYGSFSKKFIDEISDPDPRNPIVRVEKSIDFFTPQELPLEYEYQEVTVETPLLEAKVGIVDSGITNHPLLKNLILGTKDFINNPSNEDHSHGTFVAGRAIFGNDIEAQIRDNGRLIPTLRVLDIKVMKHNQGASDREILHALIDTINDPRYSDIKIFNLSLNYESDSSVIDGKKSFFTRELDAIAYKHKICLIVTAGNQHSFQATDYPNCLLVPHSIITSPGDIVNGLSVGSLADSESSRSLAFNNEPSPFTRTGPVNCRKPDVAHFGGNTDKYGNYAGIGVRGLSTNHKKIYENVGTSFAAPLVSSIAAQIHAYLKANGQNSIDLVKALLLHSSNYNLPINSKISNEDLYRIVGFGIPDFSRALDCSKSSATFIYTGSIEAKKDAKEEVKEYKHKIKFVVPAELEGKHKKIRVRGTLVYTPLISESGQIDYTLADVDINLHYRNSKGTDRSAGLSSEKNDHRVKWNTVKSFEKMFSHYKNGDWEVWITLTTRGKAEVNDYSQEYALVITVEDMTPDISKRVSLHRVIREQHKNYITIDQQVKTRVRV